MRTLILLLLPLLLFGEEKFYDRLGYDEESNRFIGEALKKEPSKGIYFKVLTNASGQVEQISRMEGGKLKASEWGVAIEKFRYDDNGLLIEKAFFDAEDKPANGRGGISRTIALYNKYGKVIEETNMTFDDKPASPICRKKFTYDDQGRLTREEYFAPENKALQGLAKRVYTYEGANIASISGFDSSGMPYADKYGIISIYWRYDKTGRRTEEGYIGSNKKPILGPFGFASFKVIYDDKGRITEKRFEGSDGKPINAKDGYARVNRVYDDQDRLKEIAYFDASGKPASNKEGVSKETYEYINERNNYVYKCFDVNGQILKQERHLED